MGGWRCKIVVLWDDGDLTAIVGGGWSEEDAKDHAYQQVFKRAKVQQHGFKVISLTDAMLTLPAGDLERMKECWDKLCDEMAMGFWP